MHLTRYSDYSLRVLIYLAVSSDGTGTVSDIAGRYGIARNHLVKVVHNLGLLGYIKTMRGRGGGLQLALRPKEINLGELIRQIEPGFEIVECFAASSKCVLTPSCTLRAVFNHALNQFFDVLDQHTLADIVRNRVRLQELLSTDKD